MKYLYLPINISCKLFNRGKWNIYQSIYVPVCLAIRLSNLSIYPSICPSVHQSVCRAPVLVPGWRRDCQIDCLLACCCLTWLIYSWAGQRRNKWHRNTHSHDHGQDCKAEATDWRIVNCLWSDWWLCGSSKGTMEQHEHRQEESTGQRRWMKEE